MKRTNKKRIIVSLLLIVVMLASTLAAAITVNADDNAQNKTEKAIQTHDIAIVFDNSGSMYKDDRWCQAIYAMEVFASMLDYENDKLTIYPMEKIMIGKPDDFDSNPNKYIDDNGYAKEGQEKLEITSTDDINKIEQIFSPAGADTILKPAYTAFQDLQNSDADQKWMIILTDGAFTKDKDISEEAEDKDATWLRNKIEENFLVDNGINIQYLGFAEASSLQGDESKNFYAANASSAEALTSELVSICNKIFNRNAIEDVSSDGSFKIGVSMNSVIAFSQGKDASIASLTQTAPDSKEISKTTDDIELNTPSQGTGFTKLQPDEYPAPLAEVSGVVATFDACSAGDYKLDKNGSVQVFYEPSVFIKAVLTDKDGNEVNIEENIPPGEYTVKFQLIDSVTGEDVTKSDLLNDGSNEVTFEGTLINGENDPVTVSDGDTVNLDFDENTRIDAKCTYLGKYSITETIKISVYDDDYLSVNVTVQTKNSGKNWYKLSDRDKWEPILVKVNCMGEPLTQDQFDKAELNLAFFPEEKEMAYRVVPAPDESAYEVYIGEDENGEPIDPETGNYRIEASVTLSGATQKDDDKFTVSTVDGFWEWLLWLLIIAGVILLIFVILNLPAWPAKMTCRVSKPKQSAGAYPIQIGNNMTLIPFKYPLSCTAKKASKLKHKFGKKAKIHISGITVHRRVETFTIGAKTYARQNGFKDGKGKEFSGDITSGKTIKMTFNGAPPLECKIDIN